MADTISLGIEVRCSKCKAIVDVDGHITQDSYGDFVISVEPCPDCLEEAREEARAED